MQRPGPLYPKNEKIIIESLAGRKKVDGVERRELNKNVMLLYSVGVKAHSDRIWFLRVLAWVAPLFRMNFFFVSFVVPIFKMT